MSSQPCGDELRGVLVYQLAFPSSLPFSFPSQLHGLLPASQLPFASYQSQVIYTTPVYSQGVWTSQGKELRQIALNRNIY